MIKNEPKTMEEWKTAYYRLESSFTNLFMRHQQVINYLLNLYTEKSTRIFRPSTIAMIIQLLLGKDKLN